MRAPRQGRSIAHCLNLTATFAHALKNGVSTLRLPTQGTSELGAVPLLRHALQFAAYRVVFHTYVGKMILRRKGIGILPHCQATLQSFSG